MKPPDEWTVGDVITGHEFDPPEYVLIILSRDHSDPQQNILTLCVTGDQSEYPGDESDEIYERDRYIGTLTETQMTLLSLEAYEVLHAQLKAQFFPKSLP